MKTIFRLALCLVVLFSFAFVQAPSHKKQGITVVIDVAHGGIDNGVEIGATSEKKLLLEISEKIRTTTKSEHTKIHFTRTGDENLSLKDRIAIIEAFKPDVVVSLHINTHADASVQGVELIVAETSSAYLKSVSVAEKLKYAFNSSEIFEKTTIKSANHYLLKNLEIPAVTLELGFLSNASDLLTLTSEEGQYRIAEALVAAIEVF